MLPNGKCLCASHVVESIRDCALKNLEMFEIVIYKKV